MVEHLPLNTLEGRRRLWDILKKQATRSRKVTAVNSVLWWLLTVLFSACALLWMLSLCRGLELVHALPLLEAYGNLLARIPVGWFLCWLLLYPVLCILAPVVLGRLLWYLVYLLWPRQKIADFPAAEPPLAQLTALRELQQEMVCNLQKQPRYGIKLRGFRGMRAYFCAARPRGCLTVTVCSLCLLPVAFGAGVSYLMEASVAKSVLAIVLSVAVLGTLASLGVVFLPFAFPNRKHGRYADYAADVEQALITCVKANHWEAAMAALAAGEYAQARSQLDCVKWGKRPRYVKTARALLEYRMGQYSQRLRSEDLEQMYGQFREYAAEGKEKRLAVLCQAAAQELRPLIAQRTEQRQERQRVKLQVRAERAAEFEKRGMELYNKGYRMSAKEELGRAVQYGSVDALPVYISLLPDLRSDEPLCRELLMQLQNAKKSGFANEELGKLAREMELMLQACLASLEKGKKP